MKHNVDDSTARFDALPAKIYQVIKDNFVTEPRKELKATKLFYVNKDYPEYVKNITWEKYTTEGEAAIVAEGSKNIPLLNDYVTDVTSKVVTVKQGLVITDIEKKAIDAGHQKFQTNRVSEIRYKINSKIDSIVFQGDAQSKIVGIGGLTGTKEYTLSKKMDVITGRELLEEIRQVKVKSQEDEIWDANILLVPQSMWGKFSKGMSETNPKTALSYIYEEKLFDIVEPVSALDKLPTPMMIAIDGAKDNLEIALPQEPKMLSEHVDTADNIQINFGARTAGLMVYHEQAIVYVKQPN